MSASLHPAAGAVLHAVQPLVAATGPQGPNEDTVSPGLLGFLTVFGLALAVVLLVRSMVKHLRKVRYSLDPDGNPWQPPGAALRGTLPVREPVAREPLARGTAPAAEPQAGPATGEGPDGDPERPAS